MKDGDTVEITQEFIDGGTLCFGQPIWVDDEEYSLLQKRIVVVKGDEFKLT